VCQSIDHWDTNGASDETIAVARKSYNELCREGMPHVAIANDTVAAVGPYNTDLVPPARPSETAFTLAATLKVELDTRRALGLPSGTAVTLSAALPDEEKPHSVCYVYGTIRGAFVLTQAAGMLRRLMQAPGYELAASTTDSSNPPRLLIEVRARASEDDGESLTDDDTAAIQAWLGKWESSKVIIVRPEDADGLRELGPADLKSRLRALQPAFKARKLTLSDGNNLTLGGNQSELLERLRDARRIVQADADAMLEAAGDNIAALDAALLACKEAGVAEDHAAVVAAKERRKTAQENADIFGPDPVVAAAALQNLTAAAAPAPATAPAPAAPAPAAPAPAPQGDALVALAGAAAAAEQGVGHPQLEAIEIHDDDDEAQPSPKRARVAAAADDSDGDD